MLVKDIKNGMQISFRQVYLTELAQDMTTVVFFFRKLFY
jgi:hypothetical protein